MTHQSENIGIEQDTSVSEAKWMLLSVAIMGVMVFGTGLLASVVSA